MERCLLIKRYSIWFIIRNTVILVKLLITLITYLKYTCYCKSKSISIPRQYNLLKYTDIGHLYLTLMTS